MIRTRLPGVLLLGLTGAGLGWALAGGPLLLLWCAAGVAVGISLLRWMSAALALAATIAALLVLELLLLSASAAIGDHSLPVELSVWAAIGGSAAAGLVLRPARSFARHQRAVALAVAVGPVFSAALFTLVAVLPGALHLAWAMNHDAVRDLVAARQMYENGGISQRVSQPTPLPFGIVSSNFAPGRASAGDLLRFDVTRLAEVWALVIVVTCLLFGVIAAEVFRRSRPAVAIPLVICAGLGGLSSWVCGIQFAGGFLNAGFGIILLLAGWLAFIASERRHVGSTVVLVLAAVAALAVWGPLAICLLALGAVSLGHAVLTGRSRRTLVVVLAAVALFVAYATTVTLPVLISSSGDLASDGYFPDLLSPLIAVVALIFVIVAAIDGFRTGRSYGAFGALSLAASVVLGLAYLIFVRRNSPDLLGYYPEKFAWLTSILLIVVAISLIGSSLQHHAPFTSVRAIALAAVIAAAAGIASVSGPSSGLLRGSVDGITTAQAEEVFALEATGTTDQARNEWVRYYLLGLPGN